MAGEFRDLAKAYQDAEGQWLADHPAIIAAFAANPVRVLPAVDDRNTMPVLQTGESDFRSADQQDSPARICTTRIHIWTRESGFDLCKTIGGAVLEAMTVTDAAGINNGLAVPGYQLSYGFNVLERYMRDPTANVRHGVLDFELRFEPAA